MVKIERIAGIDITTNRRYQLYEVVVEPQQHATKAAAEHQAAKLRKALKSR